MDSGDTRNQTRKLQLYFLLGSFLLSIFIHCWGQQTEDQLMALMMKQVQLLRSTDRNSFIDLCISKNKECTEQLFSGPNALFSWQDGVKSSAKERFWGTYQCVYRKVLEDCPEDGGWTEWSQWSHCKAECEDKGQQTRTRVCENPKPKLGGEPCDGSSLTNRFCIGACKNNSNGIEEANEYISQTHSVFSDLEYICMKRHCFYEEVQKIIKDKSKVDKYWSSIMCVKYNGPCPVNGGWSEWGRWSKCSVQCGHGELYRKRECNNPTQKNGGIYCPGEWYETKLCLAKRCTAFDAFTDWSDFSRCSVSCGIYGIKTSIKSCLIDGLCYIDGVFTKEMEKNVPCYGGECPQFGGWSKWGEWVSCSAKCGSGRKARIRRCDNPAPSNGEDCPGENIYVASCDGRNCVQLPGDSGGNLRRRRSDIIFPVSESENIQQYIPALRAKQFNSNEEYYWRINENENSSSRSNLFPKGQGIKKLFNEQQSAKYLLTFNRNVQNQTSAIIPKMVFSVAAVNKYGRTRLFIPESSKRHQKYSKNINFKHESMKHREKHNANANIKALTELPKVDLDDPFNLPLNPDMEFLFTQWSPWTHCTQTCGGGTRHRRRKCKSRTTVCRGEIKPVQFCNSDPCSVPGGWGTWMGWTPCSVTCGVGVTERYRACDHPLPAFGGSCSGVNSETEQCIHQKCHLIFAATAWKPWSQWSACSMTCGGGTRTRTRSWKFENPLEEKVLCNPRPCSEKGLWAAWGSWSTCNLPCGLGSTFRDRTCTDPAPTYGGDPCDGPGSEVQTCFSGPCIDEDDYGVLFRGTGYLKYSARSMTIGFLMVFMRIKLIQEMGTLFHLTDDCGSIGLTDCDLSIQLSLTGRNVHLEIKTNSSKIPLKMHSTASLELDQWQDIFIIVTECWSGMRLNDEAYVVNKFASRIKHGLSFDGELIVGANRLKQDGIHAIIGVMRKNFKVLLLFKMDYWSGYGHIVESANVDKIQLPLEVRHPNFKVRYYSHLFFRKVDFLRVFIIFQITGLNGLLLFNGGMETNSSVAVIVKDGALEFCLNCGKRQLCRKAYELKTFHWYILRLSVKGNEEQIRMNDGDAMQIMCPAGDKYLPRSSLYVGGAGSDDWKIIEQLTRENVFYNGMIDTLVVNDLAVTYKMSSLVDLNGWVNSLGYSLADHVTEVYESDTATTTLRCGVPETVTHSHLIRIIWLQDMKRIVSGVGAEILESDSLNQTVSKIILHSIHHYEGVYACILSSDGVLVNLHVFVLIRYKGASEGDDEAFAEWVLFIFLLLLILLVLLPLLIYYCTKDHPCWNRCRKAKKKKEEQPLMEESETTEEETPVVSSIETTEEESPSQPSLPSSPVSPVVSERYSSPESPPVLKAKYVDPCEAMGGKKLTFAEQMFIQMPPFSQLRNPAPAFDQEDDCQYFGLNFDYPCPTQAPEWDPCSNWGVNYPCHPCIPVQPCFIPPELSGKQNLCSSGTIRNIDFLSNPYYLSGSFKPCNVNQNNPSTDHITNNAAAGISNVNNCEKSADREDNRTADKISGVRNLYEKRTCSKDTETCSQKHRNSTEEACSADSLMYFDDDFTSHSEQKSFQNNAICNLEMVDMSSFRCNQKNSRNKNSSGNAEVKEESFIFTHKKHPKSKQVFGGDYSVSASSLRPTHPSHKYHPRTSCRSKTDLQKQLSEVKDEAKNSAASSCIDEQHSANILAKGIGNSHSQATRDSGTYLSSSRISAPTTHGVRGITGQHKRTKSVSKVQDASPGIGGMKEDVQIVHEYSNPSTPSSHPTSAGASVLPQETNSQGVSQLTVTESTQYFQVRGGQVFVKKIKHKLQK